MALAPNSTSVTRVPSDTLKALADLGAATIYEAQGQEGSVSPVIRPLDPTSRIAGQAFTADIGWGDNLMVHEAMRQIEAGHILVLDAHGCTEAGPWGDVLTAQAKYRGVVGLVIDGAVRDSADIIDLAFPAFVRGVCIRGTSKTYSGSVGQPVTIGGIAVRPGDVVVGDRDGLVVIPLENVDQALAAARQREAKEDRFREMIEQGSTTADLLGLVELLDSNQAERARS